MVSFLRHYRKYIRQWNRNTMQHNGQRQGTGCQFYCPTYGYGDLSDCILMIPSQRWFTHVVWQPWFVNISVVRHRGFFMTQAVLSEYSIQCNTYELHFGKQCKNKSHNFVALFSRHSKFRKVNWTNFLIVFWTLKFWKIWLRVLPARPV
jgi:hypothetical protein